MSERPAAASGEAVVDFLALPLFWTDRQKTTHANADATLALAPTVMSKQQTSASEKRCMDWGRQ